MQHSFDLPSLHWAAYGGSCSSADTGQPQVWLHVRQSDFSSSNFVNIVTVFSTNQNFSPDKYCRISDLILIHYLSTLFSNGFLYHNYTKSHS
jgi:hypothetical protein